MTNEPGSGPEESALWIDPDSGCQGLLLSDRIRFYAQRVRLITPFVEANLAPASYDLTLGAEYWYSNHAKDTGKSSHAIAPGEFLTIPPNSIVFVSTIETLRMPFYLVGRFNLKLRLLHEGLLVGTGPQIDPGFRGRLSCPIHNISNEKISLAYCEKFAVIEFQKTTPFAQDSDLHVYSSETLLRQEGEQHLLAGIDGGACLTFPSRSLDREPIKRYVPTGKLVSSSVDHISQSFGDLKATVSSDLTGFKGQLYAINLVAYLSVAVIAITLAAYFWSVVNWNKGVNDSTIRIDEQVKAVRILQSETERRLQELDRRVTDLTKAKQQK